MGLPNKTNAGDAFVSGSMELRYISKALWNLSTSKDPDASMLSISILLTVLTANSALQLACGFATDDILCLTPQAFKNSLVFPAVNYGPPSEVNSSGMPNVTKVSRRRLTRPSAPDSDRYTIGQFEYLSTMTTYSLLL